MKRRTIARFAVQKMVVATASIMVLMGPMTAIGQDVDPSNTAVTRTDDYIYARQLLMEINEADMPAIDRAAAGQDVDLAHVKELAYEISSVLTIAPHMFPSATKPMPGPDGSPPATSATAAIWEDFDGFYDRMMAAADVAYQASQAADIDAFRPLAKQLRADCDSCHDKFMHVFDPTTGQ